MKYPVASQNDWSARRRSSVRDRIARFLRNHRYRARATPATGITMDLVTGLKVPLSADAIVLLCVLKDGMKYLPSFLAHYRSLGIARFAIVDDASLDGSGDYLAAQPDVDLYRSNVGFRASEGGLVWRDLLVARYGRDRWYVSIDCDEYLVFPDAETRPLRDFVASLESRGLRRALAAMIDIYPDSPLGAVAAAERPETFPAEICPLYDGDSYRIADEKFCTAVRGGPRHRVFGTDMRLSKFPVIFVDGKTQFAGGSHHGPLPLDRNYGPVLSVLLHYKFPEGSLEDFRTIAERGTHFGDSQYYRDIVGHAAFGETSDFRYPGTRRYRGSRAMVAEGFMDDVMMSR